MNIAVVILDGLSLGLVLQYLSIVQPDSHHPNSRHPFHRAWLTDASLHQPLTSSLCLSEVEPEIEAWLGETDIIGGSA